MSVRQANLQAIAMVAQGLGELSDKVAFVGGAAVTLYIDDTGAADARATRDVDCVIELSKLTDFSQLEGALRQCGFQNDIRDGAPICRWLYHGQTVDIVPSQGSIFGFANRWYPDAMRHLQRVTIEPAMQVNIFALPYFLASKLEAFVHRGKRDYWVSHDLEDIIAVLDGSRTVAQQLAATSSTLRDFLQRELGQLMEQPDPEQIVMAHLVPDGTEFARAQRILRTLSKFLG